MSDLTENNINNWSGCKNILCIRADNLGDLLMSSPAISALKETFKCKITLLTSSMATSLSPFLPDIDDVIVCDFPWIKKKGGSDPEDFLRIKKLISERNFDAAVIFTVYSQNPLPAAMLAYLAGIPKTLAYCRENPYELLTHWCPEKEPLLFIRHQVRRDLDLVASIGAKASNENLRLNVSGSNWLAARDKLVQKGIDISQQYILLHAGVSEEKRKFSEDKWVETGKRLVNDGRQVILTGTLAELPLAERIRDKIGTSAISMAGDFNLGEFIALIQHSALVLSVNTATVHLAAAVQTPVIVLYALTNPQHLPWKAAGKYFVFQVPEEERSKNEIIRYVHENFLDQIKEDILTDDIYSAAIELLKGARENNFMPEMVS